MSDQFTAGVLTGVALTFSALGVYARRRKQRHVARGEGLSSECPGCGERFRYGHPSQRRTAFDLHMVETGCCWEPVA